MAPWRPPAAGHDDGGPEVSERDEVGGGTGQPRGWGPPPGSAQTPPGDGVPPPGGWGPAPGGRGPAPGGWGPAPGGASAPAPMPGVVPLRPLAVGELLDGSLQSIRRNPRPMVLLPLVAGAVYGVLSALVQLLTAPRIPAGASGDEVAAAVDGALTASLALVPLGVLFGLVLVGVTAVLTVVVARAALGERTTTGAAWRFARSRVLPALGLSVVVTVAAAVAVVVLGGLLVLLGVLVVTATGGVARVLLLAVLGLVGIALLVAVLVLYLGRLGVAPVVVVLDGRFPDPTGRPVGVFAAIRRTWELTRGNTWRNVGVLLLVQILAGVVGQVLGVAVALLTAVGGLAAGGGATTIGPVAAALTVVVSLVVTLPFTAAASTLLYVDLRMRREGLDLELANAADAARPAW